jgi:hypothetical protein
MKGAMMTEERTRPASQTNEQVIKSPNTTAEVVTIKRGQSASNLLGSLMSKPPTPPADVDGGNTSAGTSKVSGTGGDNAGGAVKKS